jgi:hypothetical protein
LAAEGGITATAPAGSGEKGWVLSVRDVLAAKGGITAAAAARTGEEGRIVGGTQVLVVAAAA